MTREPSLPRSRVAFTPGSKLVLSKTRREKFALRNKLMSTAGKTEPEHNSGVIVVLNDAYFLIH